MTEQYYKRKPLTITAISCSEILLKNQFDYNALPSWVKSYISQGKILLQPNGMKILTLEGVMNAIPSDMIIKGVEGEIYPCKHDIFLKTYELTNNLESDKLKEIFREECKC